MSLRRDQISAGVTKYLGRYLQISAQMSFPPGNVVVTPFVGADDENDGAVVPPQARNFSRTSRATTTTASKTRTARIALPRASPYSALNKLGGGMMDTALAMLTAGIAASHLRMHRRELRR